MSTLDKERFITTELNIVDPRTLGSADSGNFGHAGRPGQVGGSAPGGGRHLAEEAKIGIEKIRALVPKAREEAGLERVGQQLSVRTWQDLTPNQQENEYEYFKEENEGRDPAKVEAEWKAMTDEQKFTFSKPRNYKGPEFTRGVPTRWVTGIYDDADELAYARTTEMANKLVELRTLDLYKERGLGDPAKTSATIVDFVTGPDGKVVMKVAPPDPGLLSEQLWMSWKDSSSTKDSLRLQVAASDELGGHTRISPDAAAKLRDSNKFEPMKAYARAQWEVTQFLMHEAGQDHADVFRGLMLPESVVEETTQQRVANYFKQLPDLQLRRAGLQSTTSRSIIANTWSGVGDVKPTDKRVVLRMRVPATSIFSLPVFGKNVRHENELVVAGVPDPWEWDAWKDHAPEFEKVPMKKLKTNMRRASQPLVIDLQQEDADKPHWLNPEARKAVEDRLRSAEPAPQSLLHQAAERHEGQLELAFRYAFAKGRQAITPLLKVTGDIPSYVTLADKASVAIEGALDTVLPGLLYATLRDGGHTGATILNRSMRTAAAKKRTTVSDSDLEERVREALDEAKAALKDVTSQVEQTVQFDARNPDAVKWASEHAAELVKEILETTRDRIRLAVEDWQREGNYEQAYERIHAAVGDEDRAYLIARHETMLAANEGQRQSWEQAEEKGLLTGTERRMWIVTPDERLCPICAGLEGKTATLGGLYPGDLEGPPAHVQCRCTEGIVG